MKIKYIAMQEINENVSYLLNNVLKILKYCIFFTSSIFSQNKLSLT